MTEVLRIAKLCEKLSEKHDSRNPFEIAAQEGIHLRFCPEFQTLKGMYKVILGQRFIFLNGNLKRREAREVLAHELGHDTLHREMAENSIVQDHFLLDMRLKPEYEANLFAAHLLLDDNEVAEVLKEGLSLEESAARLSTPVPFLEMKITILEEKGII
ncbi:MAG: ImmA/IrrE family metallo-endopeptidase [Clostridia bacterium]|nr:ImmA/IrrE family metallo-endopeptidase [Clostridia bacterium]